LLIDGAIPPQAQITATVSALPVVTAVTSFVETGTGVASTTSGAPTAQAITQNAIIVSGGEEVYRGDISLIPDAGAYIPLGKVVYNALDGSFSKVAFFSVVPNAAGTGRTYAVIDKELGTPVVIPQTPVSVSIVPCFIFRAVTSDNTFTGGSAITSAMFGLVSEPHADYSALPGHYSLSSTRADLDPNETVALSIPDNLRDEIIAGYPYVSISGDIFTIHATSFVLSQYNNGFPRLVTDIIDWEA
jgi:hypothetical protein